MNPTFDNTSENEYVNFSPIFKCEVGSEIPNCEYYGFDNDVLVC